MENNFVSQQVNNTDVKVVKLPRTFNLIEVLMYRKVIQYLEI